MAMSTQMNRSPVDQLGLKRPRQGGGTGLPGLDGPTGPERPGFADMLREVSRGIKAPRPQDDVRPTARQQQEPRSPDAGRPESPEDKRPVDDKPTTQRPALEKAEPDAVDIETDETDDEAAARAAAATQVVQSLTTQITDDGSAGDEEVPTEGALSLPAFQSPREADSRQVRTQATPSASAQVQAATEIATQPLDTSGGSGGPGGAFDMLSPQELADVDVQVETEGGEMMERLQQALATNNVEDLDELGRPVVPQVVRSMAALARNGVSEMRLQLQPADLGEIELRVRAVEGVIRGEVMVQNAEVKNLLDSQIERLRAALEAQGLRLEGFDVGVSDDGAFANGRDSDGAGHPFGRPLESDGDDPSTTLVSAVPRQPIRLSDDAVDWLV